MHRACASSTSRPLCFWQVWPGCAHRHLQYRWCGPRPGVGQGIWPAPTKRYLELAGICMGFCDRFVWVPLAGPSRARAVGCSRARRPRTSPAAHISPHPVSPPPSQPPHAYMPVSPSGRSFGVNTSGPSDQRQPSLCCALCRSMRFPSCSALPPRFVITAPWAWWVACCTTTPHTATDTSGRRSSEAAGDLAEWHGSAAHGLRQAGLVAERRAARRVGACRGGGEKEPYRRLLFAAFDQSPPPTHPLQCHHTHMWIVHSCWWCTCTMLRRSRLTHGQGSSYWTLDFLPFPRLRHACGAAVAAYTV